MSAVPAAKSRRIGDILLELGFATEADLARATIEQERTGQPLGQILVELGCITRLELASALAEQWSDQSASIKLLPIPTPASASMPAPDPDHDDNQYAARLQDAVAELALRVGAGAAKPDEEFDDRVTDLAERVEATVARTQRLEATLATLAESFEGVTGGVEEAFGAFQSGVAGLALDLARIDATVVELTSNPSEAPAPDPALMTRLDDLGAAVAALAARPANDPETESRLDELTARVESLVESAATEDATLSARIEDVVAAVATLAERPFADPDVIADRLDALASRVETIVTPDEVVALHDSLVAFEQRLAVLAEDAGSTAVLDEQARSLAEQSQSLAELRAMVAELGTRPVDDPELDERLARIETQFAERLAAMPDSGQIDALAARLESSADEHESLADAVAQLGVRIDEMTRQDGTARLEEIQDRVEAFASTLAEVRQALAAQEEAGASQRLDELGQSLAAMRDEVAALGQSVTPADQIEQIAHRVEDLAAERDARQALAARLDEVESRLTADMVTSSELARALAEARDDLTSTPAPLPDPRIDELAHELASLRDAQGPDPRIDRLADDLTEVRARLAEVSTTPDPVTDPEVRERLEALATRIEQLAGDGEADTALAVRLDDLERRFPAEIVTPDELTSALVRAREELASTPPTAALDPRFGELTAELASLRQELSEARQAPAPVADAAAVRDEIAALARRIEELPVAEPREDAPLVAKLEELEQRLDASAPADPRLEQLTHDLDALRADLASAAASELEGTIGALAARVDSLAAVVAAAAPDIGAAADELQRLVDERVEAQLTELLAERVAELTSGLEERLAAAAEEQPRAGGSDTGETAGLEDLLERNRMTIERLGLHLGEHDRALAELMGTRNLPKRLDELAARVDEIAGGAPTSGGAQQPPGTRREIGSFSAAEPSTGEVRALMRRVEDAEVASAADREKLMNRLERMASSIDWRLQRLEAAETAAASASAED